MFIEIILPIIVILFLFSLAVYAVIAEQKKIKEHVRKKDTFYKSIYIKLQNIEYYLSYIAMKMVKEEIDKNDQEVKNDF